MINKQAVELPYREKAVKYHRRCENELSKICELSSDSFNSMQSLVCYYQRWKETVHILYFVVLGFSLQVVTICAPVVVIIGRFSSTLAHSPFFNSLNLNSSLAKIIHQYLFTPFCRSPHPNVYSSLNSVEYSYQKYPSPPLHHHPHV